MARGRHPHHFARMGGRFVAESALSQKCEQCDKPLAPLPHLCGGMNRYEAEALARKEAERIFPLVPNAWEDDNATRWLTECHSLLTWTDPVVHTRVAFSAAFEQRLNELLHAWENEQPTSEV